MKFFLAGEWQDRDAAIEVTNPFSGEVLDTVPRANAEDLDLAVKSAVRGAEQMAKLSGYERFEKLRRAADRLQEQAESVARTLSLEEGKTIHEARTEVQRAVETLELSGEEAKRISGELLPLSGSKNDSGELGFTLRVPCGIVAAITPFNFPLNLVCHKVAPALAAGNAVILKPASDTPLSALKLVEILLEAGFPPLGINCLTGGGGELGEAICRDSRIRKISFTGSQEVGEKICRLAGIKKVTMELGSNSPLIVLPDADLEKVANAAVASGYSNAGQVCISTQRLIVCDEVHDSLMERLVPKVRSIATGDPLDEATKMGPMIRHSDAERVEEWIAEAENEGATVACGGGRSGANVEPTVIIGAKQSMKVVDEELFGPAVAVQRVANVENAIRVANDTEYGLSAGVFTQDLDAAVRFAREVQSGNIHINFGPAWRADLMPYGGLKQSGLGKEGPKYAVAEMTEAKTVVIHPARDER